MHAFEAAFAKWVIKARWLIIAISLIFVALASIGARDLYFTNNYRVYFGPDNPQRVAFEKLESTYLKNENVMIVMAPKDGNVFTPKTLAVIEQVTKKAWQTPYSNRVDSITNYQHSEGHEDDLVVGDLVTNAAELGDAELARVKGIALADPLLRKRLISEDGRVTAVNVNVQLPGINEREETPAVMGYARQLVADTKAAHPELDYYITGMSAMEMAFSEASLHDLAVLVPVSFAVMIIILMALVGGITGTVTTVFVIAFAILAAMGIAGYLGYPITPSTAPAPNIILTVAVANCVHILVSYLYGVRHGESKHAALEESLRINLQPVFLASLTTAIGFLTMNLSEVPPFQQLGNIVAIGVMISFVLAITFLPAAIAVLPTGAVKRRTTDDPAMAWVGTFVVRHRARLLWGVTVIVVLVVANVPRNELNDEFLHYFDKSIPFRTDTDFTIENLTGLYTVNYSLDSGEPGGINEPEFLREADAFVSWWRSQPEVVHVATVTDIMKRLNKNLHGDDASMYRLPDDRELAAQYLLLYEMSLPYGLDLNNRINVDRSSTRVTAALKAISINEIIRFTDRAEAWLHANAPAIQFDPGSGTIIMFSHIGHRNIRAMLLGTTVALVLISGVLMFALRSFKIGALSLIPNLAPIAMGFGIWGIFEGEIGLSLSVVSSMTFGIVVDDTVHFLSKYLRAQREQGLSSPDAIRYAFSTIGRALLITSVVLVAGFLVLATSHFELNSAMGLLAAIVIIIALFAVFFFLPPLLMTIEEKAKPIETVSNRRLRRAALFGAKILCLSATRRRRAQ